MQETQVRSLGWEEPLEEEMATYSSIVAWEIPWTEKPSGLQSMGCQIVGQDWVHTHTHTHTPHLTCGGIRITLGGSRNCCAPPLGDTFSEEVTTAQKSQVPKFHPLLTKKENKAQTDADFFYHTAGGVNRSSSLPRPGQRKKNSVVFERERPPTSWRLCMFSRAFHRP